MYTSVYIPSEEMAGPNLAEQLAIPLYFTAILVLSLAVSWIVWLCKW